MRFTKSDLEKYTVKQLLEVAKELEVKGRHEMKKAELVDNCLRAEELRCKKNIEVVEQPVKLDFENELAKEIAQEVWSNEMNVLIDTNKNKIKTDYIENAKVGTIIAFQINGSKVISGMIDEIHKNDFVVKTKNSIRFTVRKKNVLWVKTGDRWPKGIYLALKGEGATNECKGYN